MLMGAQEEKMEGKFLVSNRGIHWRHRKVFSKENFGKILQVSHFHLGFLPGKNNNEIIHFHRFLLGILDPDLENMNETLYEYENSGETL